MTDFLARLLGRFPIGWLQLTHNRSRMAAAIAGVAFANILVLIQIGMLSALNGTIFMSYKPFEADIVISPSDANTLTDGSNVPRRYLYQALSLSGVEAGAPLYIGLLDWTLPNGNAASLQVYGLPPEAIEFVSPGLADQFPLLMRHNTALIDGKTRGLRQDELSSISENDSMEFEINGLTINAVGSFSLGAGFTADGGMIVSDQTFLRLFPRRVAGAPSHLLIKVSAGQDLIEQASAITGYIDSASINVRPLYQMIDDDVEYQTTQRPVGVIFGFGVFIGLLVGLVIVYQVLATDVADHIKEYATFMAIGYSDRFFLGVIFEEAVTLAVLGFVPGVLIASGIYTVMASATGLPIVMDLTRMLAVFLGTVSACVVSGFFATRRLAAADPADLF